MRLLLERRGDVISLLPPIKRGGEGTIHPIASEPGMVAKLFSKPTRERAEKLRAMIDNPPVLAGNAPVLLAWPLDRLLTRTGECVGYVMPHVKNKESLFAVAHPATRPRWADHRFLLRVAKNIALAISAFHRHGYVLGDVNESNILIGKDGSVALVDTDSVQVRTTRKVFRCQVGKPEFTAPELIRAGRSFGETDRYPHHDAFGLSVLIFQLLMDGNHPFAARYVGTSGRETLTERIAKGKWPYGRNQSSYRPRRDTPPLQSLSPEIQSLMKESFEAGHKNPMSRPTADDWHQGLSKGEEEWNKIGPKLRYFYHRKLNGRAWGQKLLEGSDRLRAAVASVPRRAWMTSSSIVLLGLLIFAFPRFWPGSSVPRPEPASELAVKGPEPTLVSDTTQAPSAPQPLKHGEPSKPLSEEPREGLKQVVQSSDHPEQKQKVDTGPTLEGTEPKPVKPAQRPPHNVNAETKKNFRSLLDGCWSSPVTFRGIGYVQVVSFGQNGTCSRQVYSLGFGGRGPVVATSTTSFHMDSEGFVSFSQAGVLIEQGKVTILSKTQWRYEILHNSAEPQLSGTELTFTREP